MLYRLRLLKQKFEIKRKIHALMIYKQKKQKKIHNTFSPLQLIIIIPVVENDISSSQPRQIKAAKITNS